MHIYETDARRLYGLDIWFYRIINLMVNYYKRGMQPMSVIFHILPVHVNGVQSTFHAEVSELRIKVLYKAWIT